MFSIHRFDPEAKESISSTQKVPAPSQAQDPLARLHARLKAKTTRQAEEAIKTAAPDSLKQPIAVNISTTSADPSNSGYLSKLEAIELGSAENAGRPAGNGDDDGSIPQSPIKPITRKHKARIELGLTGANAIPLPTFEGPKEKTASKRKYLKRKKLRAQARKKSASQADKSNKQEETESVAEHDEDSSVRSPSKPVEGDDPKLDSTSEAAQNPTPTTNLTSIDIQDGALSQMPSDPSRPAKRPKNLEKALERVSKKRRKLEHTASSIFNDADTVLEPEECPNMDEPTQPGALPRFPAPTRPSLPDPQLLARLAMGLTSAVDGTTAEDPSFLSVDNEAKLDLDTIPLRGKADISKEGFALSQSTINRLKELGLRHLLPVQIAVLSSVLGNLKSTNYTPASILHPLHHPPPDLCVSAPTGSGKTLSYIVPIVETLASRTVVRLRALIVLPTRDLVLQVKNTFETFAKGTGLKLAIVTGQHSFAQEQALLSGSRAYHSVPECKVDVVIATPGRLIDHINQTSGFSLANLCFLVLDEADQLLSKNQAWLYRILESKAKAPRKSVENSDFGSQSPEDDFGVKEYKKSCVPLPLLQKFLTSVECGHIPADWSPLLQSEDPCKLRPFQILLFSATLRRDPTKLAHLGLRQPLFIKVQRPSMEVPDNFSGYTLPLSLKQHLLVTTTQLKPLVLFHLIKTHEIKRALCFCKSVEGATRLVNLFQLMSKGWVEYMAKQAGVETTFLGTAALFSSDLKPVDRKKILTEFEAGQINLLICSDVIARGIDIPSVQHVINYDSPVDAKKYVHRVGRTARAGESGDAWSLVESQEAKHLKATLKASLGDDCLEKMKKVKLRRPEMEYLVPVYEAALGELGKMFGRPKFTVD
ncbi:hypothetical protein CROQUDRAFT_70907 [Cronartium quercuum f. sp. fusiforme G11]|uniref:ATP-dependent RNA helicase n=1 Tax=Cronartium quercuum f. sp. fusiforme G11 TaxID=708437 RepID=A0A9P6NXQ6_9BASI|nr:hypothetical protein CROQUDRAFT_70907 [Cronartium quercuum f. sp. fusiforme G11]